MPRIVKEKIPFHIRIKYNSTSSFQTRLHANIEDKELEVSKTIYASAEGSLYEI